MSDVPRIEGTPDPRKSGSVKNDDEIDPEKFKKIMKVDESDESQKRNKRNRAEQNDEADEEDETSETSTPAPGFSDLMDETESRDSVFNSEPKAQAVSSSADDEPTGPPGPSPFSMMTNDRTKGPIVPNSPGGLIISSTGGPLLDDDPSTQKMHQKKMIKNAQKNSKKQLTKAIRIAKENATERSNNNQKSTPVPKSLIETSENSSTKIDKTNKQTTSKQNTPISSNQSENLAPHDIKKMATEAEEVKQNISNPEPEKKKPDSLVLPESSSLLDVEKKKKQAQKAEHDTDEKSRDQEKTEKETMQIMQQQDQVNPVPDIAPLTQSDLPAYSTLSSKVYELYEKFVGLITLQQTTDSSKTTVKLNMPGSVYNKAEIVLEKFSSAPNTFHIQFAGSPQAIESFNANMADLVAAFQANKRSFEVNISKPYLLKEHRHNSKKIDDADKKGKQDKEEDE